jgi:spore germination protein KA
VDLQQMAALETSLLWLLCENLPLSASPARLDLLRTLLEPNSDLGELRLPRTGAEVWRAYYLESMTDAQTLNEGLVAALSAERPVAAVASTRPAATYGQAVRGVLDGQVALLTHGSGGVLLLEARDMPKRKPTHPVLETVVRGPHEAFVEDLTTNVSLLRRRLKDPRLTFEAHTVGRLTQTEVRLCYIQGLTNTRVVAEARRRLRAVSTDMVLDSAYIEESLMDDPYSIFPQLDFTERPDIVTAGLCEGRFAILVGGSNAALVAPVTFWSFMQAADDYYQFFYAGTFLRLLRLAFALIALLMPAFYIAVTTFHQQMIPTALLLTLMHAHIGIPLPAVVEAVVVRPSQLQRERPYIENDILATRAAFALQHIQVEPFPVNQSLTASSLASFQPTFENIRLWDWQIAGHALQQLQGLRTYYTFDPASIDRMTVQGQ